jgi:hypothetical protein
VQAQAFADKPDGCHSVSDSRSHSKAITLTALASLENYDQAAICMTTFEYTLLAKDYVKENAVIDLIGWLMPGRANPLQ